VAAYVAEYHSLRDLLPDDATSLYDAEEANVIATRLRFADPTAAEAAARRQVASSHQAVQAVNLVRVLLDTGRTDEACEVLADVRDPAAFLGMRS
jgi:predicted negative regulator of RcsB-dependent stress response